MYFTAVITLSMVGLLALLSRLLMDRWRAKGTLLLAPPGGGGGGGSRGRRGGGFTIADLFQHLMVLLCVYELLYGVADCTFGGFGWCGVGRWMILSLPSRIVMDGCISFVINSYSYSSFPSLLFSSTLLFPYT